jgi:hypothetical protein
MAVSKEIATQQTSLSGSTLYATLDSGGQRWNGTAFEAVLLAHWGTYAVAMTEAASTGYFTADRPGGIADGTRLDATIYRRVGGSPAATDPVVGSGEIGTDPWSVQLPGAYPAGSAGQILASAAYPTASAVSSTGFTLDADDAMRGSNLAGWQATVVSALANGGQTGLIASSNTTTNVQTLVIGGWPDGMPTGVVTYSLTPPNVDKAGYSLASTGLDAIATTPAGNGVTPNFRQMVVATWRRWFRKHVASGTTLTGYADDGTTAITTQSIPAVTSTQTQGPSA